MVTLPHGTPRQVIAEASLYDDVKIVGYHHEEGPLIELVVAPEGTDQRADVRYSPHDMNAVAAELTRMGEVVLRASWTPTILSDARKRLPGMTDEQIIERLDRLYGRIGGSVFGARNRLGWRADRMLGLEVHVETLDRAIAMVDQNAEVLSGIPQVADRFRELRTSLSRVKAMYDAELEFRP